MTLSPTLLLPGHFDRAEVRQLARVRREGHRRLPAIAAVVFAGGHLGVGKAVIFQLVHRHLVGRHDNLPIARLSDLERRLVLEVGEVLGRNAFESGEGDDGHDDRFAFADGHGQVDAVLLVVELDVERR